MLFGTIDHAAVVGAGFGFCGCTTALASSKFTLRIWTKKSMELPARLRSGQRQQLSLTMRPGKADNSKLSANLSRVTSLTSCKVPSDQPKFSPCKNREYLYK